MSVVEEHDPGDCVAEFNKTMSVVEEHDPGDCVAEFKTFTQKSSSFVGDSLLLQLVTTKQENFPELQYANCSYSLSLSLWGSHLRRFLSLRDDLVPRKTTIVIVVTETKSGLVIKNMFDNRFRDAVVGKVHSWLTQMLSGTEFSVSSHSWNSTENRPAVASAVQDVQIRSNVSNTVNDLELLVSFYFPDYLPASLEDGIVFDLLSQSLAFHPYFATASLESRFCNVVKRIKCNLMTFTDKDFNQCSPAHVVQHLPLYKLERFAEMYSFCFRTGDCQTYKTGNQPQCSLEVDFQASMLQTLLPVRDGNERTTSKDAKLIFKEYWMKQQSQAHSHVRFVDFVCNRFTCKYQTLVDDLDRNAFRSDGAIKTPLIQKLSEALPTLTDLHVMCMMNLQTLVLQQVCCASNLFAKWISHPVLNGTKDQLVALEKAFRSKNELIKLFTQFARANGETPQALKPPDLINYRLTTATKKTLATTVENHLQLNHGRVLKLLKQLVLHRFPLRAKSLKSNRFKVLHHRLFNMVTSQCTEETLHQSKLDLLVLLYKQMAKRNRNQVVSDDDAVSFANEYVSNAGTIPLDSAFVAFEKDLKTVQATFADWIVHVKRTFNLKTLLLELKCDEEDEEVDYELVDGKEDVTDEELCEPDTTKVPCRAKFEFNSNEVQVAVKEVSLARTVLVGMVYLCDRLFKVLFDDSDGAEMEKKKKQEEKQEEKKQQQEEKKKCKKKRKKKKQQEEKKKCKKKKRKKKKCKKKKRKKKKCKKKQQQEEQCKKEKKRKKKRARKLQRRGNRRRAKHCACQRSTESRKKLDNSLERIVDVYSTYCFRPRRDVFVGLPRPSIEPLAHLFMPCSLDKHKRMREQGITSETVFEEIAALYSQRKLSKRNPLLGKSFRYNGSSLYLNSIVTCGIKVQTLDENGKVCLDKNGNVKWERKVKGKKQAKGKTAKKASDKVAVNLTGTELALSATGEKKKRKNREDVSEDAITESITDEVCSNLETMQKGSEKSSALLNQCIFKFALDYGACDILTVYTRYFSSIGRKSTVSLSKFGKRIKRGYNVADDAVYNVPGNLKFSNREVQAKGGMLQLAKRKEQLMNSIKLMQPEEMQYLDKNQKILTLWSLRSQLKSNDSVQRHFILNEYIKENRGCFVALYELVECEMPSNYRRKSRDHASDPIDHVNSLPLVRSRQLNASKFSFKTTFLNKVMQLPIVQHVLEMYNRSKDDVEFVKANSVLIADTKLNFRGISRNRWTKTMQALGIPIQHSSEFRTSVSNVQEDPSNLGKRREFHLLKATCHCKNKQPIRVYKILQDTHHRRSCLNRDDKASRYIEMLGRSMEQLKCIPICFLAKNSKTLREKAIAELESFKKRQQTSTPTKRARVQNANDDVAFGSPSINNQDNKLPREVVKETVKAARALKPNSDTIAYWVAKTIHLLQHGVYQPPVYKW